MNHLIPLRVRVPKSFQGTEITAIRIQDVARDIWYCWDKNSTYPNGYWDNCGGGGNNAPVGEAPVITAGYGNLYVAFYAVNTTNNPIYISLYIGNTINGELASATAIYTPAGQGAGIEFTGSMPTTTYTIILWSGP
jgi:hypothetical protein